MAYLKDRTESHPGDHCQFWYPRNAIYEVCNMTYRCGVDQPYCDKAELAIKYEFNMFTHTAMMRAFAAYNWGKFLHCIRTPEFYKCAIEYFDPDAVKCTTINTNEFIAVLNKMDISYKSLESLLSCEQIQKYAITLDCTADNFANRMNGVYVDDPEEIFDEDYEKYTEFDGRYLAKPESVRYVLRSKFFGPYTKSCNPDFIGKKYPQEFLQNRICQKLDVNKKYYTELYKSLIDHMPEDIIKYAIFATHIEAWELP